MERKHQLRLAGIAICALILTGCAGWIRNTPTHTQCLESALENACVAIRAGYPARIARWEDHAQAQYFDGKEWVWLRTQPHYVEQGFAERPGEPYQYLEPGQLAIWMTLQAR